MDFVSIDFETATSDRNSPCEIGLTFVQDSKIIGTKSWLIKPKQYPNFKPFNIGIHGIHAEDVKNMPEFDTLWQSEIKSLLVNKFVIAHNASFDLSVLRNTLETYNIDLPELHYSCSLIISKKVWKDQLNYGLKHLCKYNNILINEHHRAGDDSRACADLSLKAFEFSGVNSISDLSEKLKINLGKLYKGGYSPAKNIILPSERTRNSQPKAPSLIVGDPLKHNPESIFYGRTVVITGKLTSMKNKDEAKQIIVDIGGEISNNVNKATDFLIVGQQDPSKVGKDGLSDKQKKAQKLLEEGSFIEVLTEDEFLQNI